MHYKWRQLGVNRIRSPQQPFSMGKGSNNQTHIRQERPISTVWAIRRESLRPTSTPAYLSTTSAWTPYIFCSTAFWKDIRVFSGANYGEKKSNERFVVSGNVCKMVPARFRDIREPKQSHFADYALASYTGVPAFPRQNCILLKSGDDQCVCLH